VIALDWKWLFIYPEQRIATVNYVAFPEKTPVNFQITADAPMNSFWIPQLGGQIYAMPGMSTKLHLMADRTGEFRGSSANISGEGFAGMTFTAKSDTSAGFDRWVKSIKQSPNQLSLGTYDQLAKPSQDNPPMYYSLKEHNLYDIVVMKFMEPIHGLASTDASSRHIPEVGKP
jgi:cytochrome o ubiquinol oxidase subunit 2